MLGKEGGSHNGHVQHISKKCIYKKVSNYFFFLFCVHYTVGDFQAVIPGDGAQSLIGRTALPTFASFFDIADSP